MFVLGLGNSAITNLTEKSFCRCKRDRKRNNERIAQYQSAACPTNNWTDLPNIRFHKTDQLYILTLVPNNLINNCQAKLNSLLKESSTNLP